MPFNPHTPKDVGDMLAAIGAKKIEDLFDEIPKELRIESLAGIPDALNEMQTGKLMMARAVQDGLPLNFIGAGAYEHHIPAAVWAVTTRGEFYSAYTPYQAEASQGTLQLIYEYQTMISSLTGMEVSNASLYDGGSAVAEASLMSVRAHRKSRSQRILVPTTVHPHYRKVAVATATGQGVRFEEIACPKGYLSVADLKKYEGEDITAIVIQQPNFFGVLEDVDAITEWAHANGAMVIGSVNPTSLAILKPPGEWGTKGADIACGDCQPLGVPLSSGGPYAGFLTAKMEFVRQMPGRIVGRTVDADGKQGFALTLQAREQHIRRGKATSNICTNQGLLVTAATIYLSLLGPEGLGRVANESHRRANELVAARDKLSALDRENIRKVASLKFAQDLAPDAMQGMIAVDKNGITQVARLPAEGDPTLGRIERIRERDTAVVDTVNDYYASFAESIDDSYDSWRQTSFTELEKEMRARSSARTRTVLGAAALLASIFAPTSCNTYDACRINDAMRTAGTMGGIAAVLSGIKKYADARVHADALKELTQSFQAEVAPQVVEVEGHTLRLTGTAEDQYREWRKLLKQLYIEETGAAAVAAPAAAPAPATTTATSTVQPPSS